MKLTVFIWSIQRTILKLVRLKKSILKHTFTKVPIQPIRAYRLNLHEAINDYLMRADVKDIAYFYRVKTSESILDKIERFKERREGYPVSSILNDIFGARMILTSEEIAESWSVWTTGRYDMV